MRRTAVAIAALLLAAGTAPAFAGVGMPKVASIEVGPHRAALHNDSPSLMTGANTLTVEIADLTADHRVSLLLVGPKGERIAVPLDAVTVLDGPGGGHAEATDSHAASPADDHAVSVDDHGAKPDEHAAKSDDHDTAARDPHGATDRHGTTPAVAPVARDSHGAPAAPVRAKLAPAADAHATGQTSTDPHGATVKGDHDISPSVPSKAAGHDGDEAEDGHGDKAEAYLARGSVSVPSTGTWTARLVIRDPHGEEVVGEAPLAVAEGGPNKLYLGFTGSLIVGSMLFGLIQRRRPDRPLSTTKDRN